MPMTVEWDDAEQTIILITITPPITWEMFDEGVDRAMDMARSVPHRVDIISNPGATQMPPGSAMPHLQRAFGNFPPNLILLVARITNFFARNMSSIVGHVYLGPCFKVADSVEAAREIIYQARAASEKRAG